MEKIQTASEWLIDKVEEHFCLLPVDLIEQAKEMEKDQIMRAYMSGEIGEMYELNPVKTLMAKQYYENNYGK